MNPSQLALLKDKGGANDTFHMYKWMTHYSLDPMDSSIENSKQKDTTATIVAMGSFFGFCFFLNMVHLSHSLQSYYIKLTPVDGGKKSHKLALPDVSDLRTINSISTSTSRRFLLKDS